MALVCEKCVELCKRRRRRRPRDEDVDDGEDGKEKRTEAIVLVLAPRAVRLKDSRCG